MLKLSTNLISAHQFTKDLNFRVIFSPHYVFEDMRTERRIRTAKEKNDLYYHKMNHGVAKENQLIVACASQNKSAIDKILTSSFSLGTPTFPLLQSFLNCLVVWMLVFFIAKSVKIQNIIVFHFQ